MIFTTHALTQPSDSMPLETAMGGLRYLAMLVATADANGVTGAVATTDMPGVMHD